MDAWVVLPMQTISFYGFRPKTVRSWFGNRMFLVRKPYGFGTENVKGKQLETDSIPFNNTLVHILNKLSNLIKTDSQLNYKNPFDKTK